MKSPDDVLAVVSKRVARDWHTWLVDGTGDVFPWRIPLGPVTSSDLADRFADVQTWAIGWQQWTGTHGVGLDSTVRMVHGSRQTLPTHVTVATQGEALSLIERHWTTRLEVAQKRLEQMTSRFPDRQITASMLRSVTTLNDTDFGLLLDAADWFTTHDAAGLTPRQVPVPGLHGKWLNHHHALLGTLVGSDRLELVHRPTRIHYTYLDPAHLEAGGRAHDAHTIGDTTAPVYPVRVAVISENKDTALYFPNVPGGISIEGNGNSGPKVLMDVPWLRDVPTLVYWGDLDAVGFEILNRYRANGLPVESILMDAATYREYAVFGTDTAPSGARLTATPPKTLTHLSNAEAEAYALVCSGTEGPLRVEQERIPLERALDSLTDTLRRAAVLR